MGHLHYVVVVHGIGTQRLGETPLPVVSRLAEARRAPAAKASADVVTLGMVASGLREQGWVAFEGIPTERPAAPLETPFVGLPAPDGDRDNLRFVDIHWADLLDADVRATAQKPSTWARGLMGRLARKGAPQPPPWAEEILESIARTFNAASLGLSWQSPALRDLLAQDYLGDVQVYGEHARTRGAAVRRFHERMNAIHGALTPEDRAEVRYTILAHSLGSIMTFDALMYAAARPAARLDKQGPWTRHGLPFHGYVHEERGAPDEPTWLARVRAFVTLGSPIDKFLTLWWFGYRHLAHPEDWMREPAELPRIRHFNYCEEQDPVGHHLDLAAGSAAYRRLFETCEDRVYVRYAIPGLAHLAYWQDAELFRWIVARAIDEVPAASDEPPPIRFFAPRVYAAVLRFSYLVPPLATALALAGLVAWARHDASIGSSAIAGMGLVVVGWFGKQAIDLSIWWRQILAAKRKGDIRAEPAEHARPRAATDDASAAPPAYVQQAIVARAGELLSLTEHAEAPAPVERAERWAAGAALRDAPDLVRRRLAGRVFRLVTLPAASVVAFAGAFLAGAAWWTASEHTPLGLVGIELGVFALALLGALAGWRFLVQPRVAAWQRRKFVSWQLVRALAWGLAVAGAGIAVGHSHPEAFSARALESDLADKAMRYVGLDLLLLCSLIGTALLYVVLRLEDVRARLSVREAPRDFTAYVAARAEPAPARPRPPEEE